MKVETPGGQARPQPTLEAAAWIERYREWVRGLRRIGERFVKPAIPADYTGSVTYHFYKGGMTDVETRLSNR